MKNILKYNYSLRIMHWLMAVIVIAELALGIVMVDLDLQTFPKKFELYAVHKSLGVLLLILVIVRISLRLSSSIPPFPSNISRVLQYLARLGHYLLYVFLFVLPLTGITASMLKGYQVPFFGVNLPNLLPLNKHIGSYFGQLHVTLPYIFIALIVLHIAAFIKHQYFDKEDIFSRIDLKK